MQEQNFQSEIENQDNIESATLQQDDSKDSSQEPEALKSSSSELKKLHRECAKYRTELKSSKEENVSLQKGFDELKSELESVKKSSKEQQIIHKLEKLGCLKPALVLNDIPHDCSDLDSFLSQYKNDNKFLFQTTKEKHGFSFKSGRNRNLSPAQQMNHYIRSAVGR